MATYSSAWHVGHVRLVSCEHYVRLRKLGFFLYLGHARAYVAYDKWTLRNLGYFRTCIFWMMQMGSKCADIIHIIINTCFESTKLLMSISSWYELEEVLIWTWKTVDFFIGSDARCACLIHFFISTWLIVPARKSNFSSHARKEQEESIFHHSESLASAVTSKNE